MKKKVIIITTCILILLYLQFGRTPVINHSTVNRTKDNYQLHLIVTVNKLCVVNKKKMAEDLVSKTIHNDFKNMYLSYDVDGYPNEVSITVYTNNITKFLNIPSFKFEYIQESPYQYNIMENPDQFSIIYQ